MIYQFFAKHIKHLLAVILILFFNFSVMANDDLFFSEMNIEVNIPYVNNSNVRNLAISKAEKLAFEKISKKLLAPSDFNQIIKFNNINYEYLVDSIEFIDEKISSNENNLFILKNDTDNIIEYVEYKNKNTKKYSFWELLYND